MKDINNFSGRRSCLCLILQVLALAYPVLINAEEMYDGKMPEDKFGVSNENSLLTQPLLEFSSNIFKSLRSEKKNLVFSPVSIQSALNMVLLGAQNGSETERELLNSLGYSRYSESTMPKVHQSYGKLIDLFAEIKEDAMKLEHRDPESYSSVGTLPILDFWATALTKDDLLPSYQEALSKFYKASAHQVPPKTQDRVKLLEPINEWGKKAGFGNELIKLSELDYEFTALLLSAVKVKANWLEDFNERFSPDEIFYNHGLAEQAIKNRKVLEARDVKAKYVQFTSNLQDNKKRRNSEIIRAFPKEHSDLAKLEFRAIDIGLLHNMSFTIFEPLRSGSSQELTKLVDGLLSLDTEKKRLRLDTAFALIDSDEGYTRISHFQMPQFKFESDLDLIEPLRSIGIKRIFEKTKTQLTNVALRLQMVDKAKHQAVIEVDKFGLKASAITTVRIVPLTSFFDPDPLKLQVKNPYMFVVRFNKLPIFMGQLVEI